MVHPDFASQHIPRPDVWEVPKIKELEDLYVQPPQQVESISSRLLNVLQKHLPSSNPAARSAIEEFLSGKVDFAASDQWHAHRMLGQGGFGHVGLWVKKNTSGATKDEIAVKEVTRAGSRDAICYVEEDGRIVEELLNEAVVHKSMNRASSENIVHLRGYVLVTHCSPYDRRVERGRMKGPGSDKTKVSAPKPINGNYRFYMEYAPYGTLDNLMNRYRAWDQYLPESFLWHVFDSLSTAAKYMEIPPDNDSIAGKYRNWPDNTQVVHFDIKTENIFMGYERLRNEASRWTGGTRELPYPTIKLSDFGIATFTNSGDPDNPSNLWHHGTRYFKPPEQIHFGVGFESPPNGYYRPIVDFDGISHDIAAEEEDDRDPGFKFLASANIWNIGKVMHDLATMSQNYWFQHSWNFKESDYLNDGERLIPDYHTFPFFQSTTKRLTPPNPYSKDLMDLIEKCLNPKIETRIKITDLAMETKRHIRDIDEGCKRKAQVDESDLNPAKRRKVYYRENEINDMELGVEVDFRPGAEDESYRRVFYRDLMEGLYDDPDWSPLKLPEAKWGRTIETIRRTTVPPPRGPWVVRNGRIWFRNAPPLSMNGADQQILSSSNSLLNRDAQGQMNPLKQQPLIGQRPPPGQQYRGSRDSDADSSSNENDRNINKGDKSSSDSEGGSNRGSGRGTAILVKQPSQRTNQQVQQQDRSQTDEQQMIQALQDFGAAHQARSVHPDSQTRQDSQIQQGSQNQQDSQNQRDLRNQHDHEDKASDYDNDGGKNDNDNGSTSSSEGNNGGSPCAPTTQKGQWTSQIAQQQQAQAALAQMSEENRARGILNVLRSPQAPPTSQQPQAPLLSRLVVTSAHSQPSQRTQQFPTDQKLSTSPPSLASPQAPANLPTLVNRQVSVSPQLGRRQRSQAPPPPVRRSRRIQAQAQQAQQPQQQAADGVQAQRITQTATAAPRARGRGPGIGRRRGGRGRSRGRGRGLAGTAAIVGGGGQARGGAAATRARGRTRAAGRGRPAGRGKGK